jgi:hypothetical protein
VGILVRRSEFGPIAISSIVENLADRVETRLFGGDDVLMLNIALGLSQ